MAKDSDSDTGTISLIRNMGGKTAVAGDGASLSYHELIRRINAAATLLDGLSGRVLVIGENGVPWICGFYAALSRRLVPVPVDVMASAEDIRYIVDDCAPAAILHSPSRAAAVAEALAGLPAAPRTIGFDALAALPADGASERFDYEPDPEATAVIIYTSGTTGSPKGVMLSYRNLACNLRAVSAGTARVYREDDRVLMLLPTHHIFPLLGTLMISLHVGATIVVCPGMSGELIVRTLKDHRVSIIIGVPRLYSMIRSGIRSKIEASAAATALFRLAGRVNSPALSRLLFGSVHRKFGGAIRHMVSGGAALDAAVAADFRTLGFDLLEGYGMTEAAPMITFTRPGTLRPGSPGQPLDGVEVEIRDGEIVARGPNVMQGYWQRPEETAEILRDGWLHTGDLGELGADGYLRITGRRKEIIVLSNGKNVNPVDIEFGLEELDPAVKEAAVYPDGDRLRAILVADTARLAAAGVDCSPEGIEAWARERVVTAWNRQAASYKLVAGFVVSLDELPRTRLGKLRRFQLPAFAEALAPARPGAAATAAEPEGVEYRLIRDYLEHEKKVKVHPGAHLALDIGLDSLDSIGFQAFIESSFGIEMPLERLAGFESVAELVRYVAAAKTRSSEEGFDWARFIRQGLAQAKSFRISFPSTWITNPLFAALSRAFVRFYFRFSARGLKNLPDQPCIIVPNHQSFIDALLVSSLLKFDQFKRTFFYAKSKHVKGGLLSTLARHNNVIVMDINKNLKESIIKVAEVLQAKRNLIIFPEGTRTKDGSLGDFKRMFAILARELNVPVVPVSIRGAFEAMPRGRRFPKPFRSVRVEILPPVFPGNLDYDSLTAKVREAIAGSLGPRLETGRA